MRLKIRQKRFFVGGLSMLAFTTLCAQQQPNVIYVFPDQFRNHAMSFWAEEGFKENVNFQADPVHTPHLNKFAKESLVLTSAMSNFPLSSPHRGMLLTGMYPDGSGIVLNCNTDRPLSTLRKSATTISDVFSQAGYDCGYIGKLHADTPTPNDPENPGQYVEKQNPVWDAYTPPEDRHGFNYWYSYGTYDVHKSPHYWDTNGKRHNIKQWSPEHEADKAVAYIANENQERDSTKPFFLMVAMNPPHSPYRSLDDCMEVDYNLYKDKPFKDLLIRANADTTMQKADNSRYYFASVTGVDREFGRILETLKKQGLDENTIVIFASDHGETMCSQGIDDPKNSPYAESMNIPFIVRFPQKIKPRVDNLVLSSPDIMPTVLGLSGLGDGIPKEVQGRNFAPLFLDENAAIERPKSALYIQNVNGERAADGKVYSYFPIARGIKTNEYTLAIYIDKKNRKIKKTLLFDDVNDPYQLNNLDVKKHKAIYKELCKEMAVILKDANDPWYRESILSELIPYEK